MTNASTTTAPPFVKTRLIFVLDRSGSMRAIEAETIGGFNAFVEEQKKVPGAATITLIQFDNYYEINYADVPLAEVKPLDSSTFQPRGYTALCDAIGITLQKAISTHDPEVKTVISVLTDGAENASKEYTYASVKELIAKAEADFGFDVLFVAANINALEVGGMLGVAANKTAAYDYTTKGMADVMRTVSSANSSLRSASAVVDLTSEYAKFKATPPQADPKA